MLYLVDFHIAYPATMTQKDLFVIWAREADAALGAKSAGTVVDLWKCVGSPRIVAVVTVDGPDSLDQILMDLPIMKEQVTTYVLMSHLYVVTKTSLLT